MTLAKCLLCVGGQFCSMEKLEEFLGQPQPPPSMSINKAQSYVDPFIQSERGSLQDFGSPTWRAFVTISHMLGCTGDLLSNLPYMEPLPH